MYNVTRLWPTWHRRGFYASNAAAIAATEAVFGVAEGKNSRRKFYFFKFPSDAMHVFYYFFLDNALAQEEDIRCVHYIQGDSTGFIVFSQHGKNAVVIYPVHPEMMALRG